MKCGLLGRTLGHSYSPQIHQKLGSYSYSLFEKEPQELEQFLRHGDFKGLNVTIPYKKEVIPYLDALSPTAKKLGAVNTVLRQPDGKLIGHNTDFFGFQTMLKASDIPVAGKKVLVCGSGGASNTAQAVLREAGAKVVVLSRSGPDNYQNLSKHRDAALIVNTTPLGMYPNVEEAAIENLGQFPKLEGVLDVIYNPARTKLLLEAEKRGLPAVNGLLMLVAQAKESAEWFTGAAIDDGCIGTIYQELQRQMENIVLIGMPGSGKTTVGKMLAQELGREFVDADAVLEQLAGRPITQIIPLEGEAVFRAMETEVLQDLGKRSGLVLATGGGCVTRPENYDALHRNGTIVWLRRPTALLPTEGRPLSQAGRLEELYQRRAPLYAAFGDLTAENSGTPQETVEEILSKFKMGGAQ